VSLASAAAELRQAMAQVETCYFRFQRIVAATVGSTSYPEVQQSCDVVAAFYKIGTLEMVGRSRMESVAWPRHVAIALTHEAGNMSLPEIGEAFGGRDHGTIYNSLKRVAAVTATNAARMAEVTVLRQQLHERREQKQLL
jgi:chromosomal replication initiator protein